MNGWRRRAVAFAALVVGVLSLYTLLYRWSLQVFEGETRSFARSLRFVVETITTVGYGTEATWASPEMNLVVTGMMLTGVLFFFLALPLLVVPMFDEALSTTPPTSVEMADHVVLCRFTGRGERFVEELSAWDTDYVVVEPDRDRAADLQDDGYAVVHGDPESPEDLLAACADEARAVIADGPDDENASIALTCRTVASDAVIVAFAEDPADAKYIRYAGADEVLTPRHILGESLAGKVTAATSEELERIVELDVDFEVAELGVQIDSEIEGKTLAESRIREATGADVIGEWRDGVFDPSPSPDGELHAGTVLLAAGTGTQLERLKSLTQSDARSHRRGRAIVVGHGEVGRTVSTALAAAGVSHTTIDREESPAVDVVGDARNEQTLQEAGVAEARTVVLALPNDTTTIFATLVLEELAPDVEVIARVEDSDNVRKLHRAGADYVLSLSTVSGRMLASTVLEEEVMTPDMQIDVVRRGASGLVGETLASADVRARTGSTVVAVQRGDELLTDLDPSFEFAEDDELVVAGSDEAINRFTELARA
jgi:Trk K+ transport system NAD-binding subunit